MTRILFTSIEPAESLAKWLATLIYEPGVTVAPGIPYSAPEGWWELSRVNDHKLDPLDGNHYAYRDRNGPRERMERIEKALRARPSVSEVSCG